jgi:predicted XRE-type DNA-binding protein
MKKTTYRNSWAALEDDPLVIADRQRRTKLMTRVQQAAQAINSTREGLVERFGINSDRAEHLLAGHIDEFSMGDLLLMLEQLSAPAR